MIDSLETSPADDLTRWSPDAALPEDAPKPFIETLLPTDAPDLPFRDMGMIMGLPVRVMVELGRTKMPLGDLVTLDHGAVVELNVEAGEPLDLVVNGCLIAQGEVVIVDDRYGIRLTDIISPSERLRKTSS